MRSALGRLGKGPASRFLKVFSDLTPVEFNGSWVLKLIKNLAPDILGAKDT